MPCLATIVTKYPTSILVTVGYSKREIMATVCRQPLVFSKSRGKGHLLDQDTTPTFKVFSLII